MQKHIRKKHPTKRVTYLNRSPRLQWRWMIAVFALVIAGVTLVVFTQTLASSQQQNSKDGSKMQAASTSTPPLTPVNTPDAQQTTRVGVFSLSTGGPIHVPANVLHHNIRRHRAKPALVNRDHRAMPAQMLAYARSFRGTGNAQRSAGTRQLGVLRQRRKIGAIGDAEVQSL